MIDNLLQLDKIFIQPLLQESEITLDILRLDVINEIVSGNKWFKLKYYLQDAVEKQYATIATFGGYFSNHIVATAYMCNALGLKSIGIIRGERPKILSHTLQNASKHGMQLIFMPRDKYKKKTDIIESYTNENWYWINEGGYGELGVKGAAEIFNWIDNSYSHIIATAGTGTMLAGLITAAKEHQQIIGLNVMKGNEALINEIYFLLPEKDKNKKFILLNKYHFGGYAKCPNILSEFMNDIWNKYHLPTDFVYSAKSIYAALDLIKEKYFYSGSKILVVHCGGLQGNNSLPKNILQF